MKNKRWLILLIVGFLLIPFNFYFVPNASADPPGVTLSDWDYYKKVTIDHTKVGSDLTNFPILFDNTSSDFSHAQSDGDDFLFVSSDNNTQYNHEIENFSSNRLIAWVNITSLSSSVDTELYLYYGNAGVGSQEDVTGTWNSGYVMVQHMIGLSATDIDDSTSNNNDVASDNGNPVYNATGKIYNCVDFDGNDNLVVTDSASLDIDNEITIEAWLYETNTATEQVWLIKGAGGSANYQCELYDDTAGDNKLLLQVAGTYTVGNTETANSNWYHCAVVYDESNARYYLDGSADGAPAMSTDMGAQINAVDMLIGTYAGALYGFEDKIDEVRISDVLRNASWIKTTYNTSNSPSTFLSVGSEQSTPPPSNDPPVLSNETPVNNSVTISVDTDLSITINDPEGDMFNYTIECSDGSSGSANGESNGSKTLVLDADLATCTVYTWWVNATDGNDTVNSSYTFTTFCPTVPADGYVLTWNETLTQLCIDLVDPQGDGMVYEIRQNDVVLDTGGVHVYTNTTHNFTDIINNSAHWESSKGKITSGLALTSTTPFTVGEYQNISSVNGSGVNTSDCYPPIWSHHNFSFDLSGYTIRDITGLEVRWYGYGGYYTGGAKPKWNWGTTMYFDTDASGWYTGGNTTPFTTDDWSPMLEWINYTCHHDMVDWIDADGVLNVAVEHTTANNCSVIYTDYIELVVTTISGGVGNGTYCTSNVSWWNDTCGTDWSWVVYVTDGRGSTSTTTYTFSNAPCTFGSVYPTTGSTGVCPCIDAICVVVTVSYNFNMTVYGRSQHETNYTIWDKYINFAADEYCFCLCGYIVDGWHQPMRYNTTYYWYVNASKFDNSSLYNQTSVFSFTTASERSTCVSSSGGGGGMNNNAMYVIGLIGIFGLLGYFGHRRRRER